MANTNTNKNIQPGISKYDYKCLTHTASVYYFNYQNKLENKHLSKCEIEKEEEKIPHTGDTNSLDRCG